MPELRAVLWDLDGTMIDSQEDHFLAWSAALAGHGFSLQRERFPSVFGHRPDEIVRTLLGPDLPAGEVQQIVAAKWQAYRERLRTHGVQLLPGVADWVKRLARDGWHQAVASDGARWSIDLVLEATGLAPSFAAVVSGQDVPHGKPDPAIFQTAAARLGTPANRCVVVEDAPAGVEAAHRAGMRAIGVLTSHDTLSADVVVHRLSDLHDGAFERLLVAQAARL
jgi:beta-phosphoglucomutase